MLSADWLVRLRWLVGGVVLVLAGATAAGVEALPPVAVAAAAGVLLLSNGLLAWWLRRSEGAGDGLLTGILVLDTVLLTVLLGVSGADTNPFVLLYILPAATAALTVRPAMAALVFLVSALGYGSLFLIPRVDLHAHDPAAMQRHVRGMYVAYLIAGGSLVAAVARVRASRDAADRQLAAAHDLEERTRRLAGLATLAAGAAHELATPLSSILVVTHELARRATDEQTSRGLALVRGQVDRCQQILAQLAGDAGLGTMEEAEEVDLPEVLGTLAAEQRIQGIAVELDCPPLLAVVPERLLEQALRRLLDNAREASPPGSSLELSCRREGEELCFRVVDHGHGMPPEQARRAGEPFFTTKPDGRGLGLYFVRSVARQLGGDLDLDSAPGQGTSACLHWPCPSVRPKQEEASP